MRKSILFFTVMIIIASDFIAEGNMNYQVRTPAPKETRAADSLNSGTKSAAETKKAGKSGKADKQRNDVHQMDNYKSNKNQSTNPREQEHMDTTLNNHR